MNRTRKRSMMTMTMNKHEMIIKVCNMWYTFCSGETFMISKRSGRREKEIKDHALLQFTSSVKNIEEAGRHERRRKQKDTRCKLTKKKMKKCKILLACFFCFLTRLNDIETREATEKDTHTGNRMRNTRMKETQGQRDRKFIRPSCSLGDTLRRRKVTSDTTP